MHYARKHCVIGSCVGERGHQWCVSVCCVCFKVLMCKARLVTYLPGLHVLVHRIAGARAFPAAGSSGSDEPIVAVTSSDMGISCMFLFYISTLISFAVSILLCFIEI